MFHVSNLGRFGGCVPCDLEGYVPEADDDDPWAFSLDHEVGHGTDGELTEYGEWWESEGFPEWRDRAVSETAQALAKLKRWQSSRP